MTTRRTARALGPSDLLAHRDWVERVARTLVHGDADAADLAQETWAAVLARPERHDPERPRGWLRAMLRFKSIDAARAKRRRRRHEEAAARRESVPDDPAEIVARAEALDRVAHAVLELDEPYRAAMLLRWFEGLTPREIAERQGLPVETVRTRLKRAVAQVRARLDADFRGDRGAWTAALLPLVGWRETATTAGGSAATVAGGMLMGTNVKVAAAAVALLLVAGALWLGPEDREPGAIAVATPPAETSAAPAPAPRQAPSPPPTVARQPGAVALEVRDWEGRPIADASAEVRVAARLVVGRPIDAAPPPWIRSARTGADGRARIGDLETLRGYELVVRAAGRGRVTRAFVVPESAEPLAIDVVLVAGCALTGRVLDAAGEPVPGAVVEAAESAEVRTALATADAAGRYAFADLPHGLVSLKAARPGDVTAYSSVEARFVPTRVRLPFGRDLDLVLRPSARIEGTVTDASSGRAIAGAKVTMYANSGSNAPGGPAVTDAEGRYLVTNLCDALVDDIDVVAPGYGRVPSSRAGAAPAPFVLRAGETVTVDIALDAAALRDPSAPGGAIEGRVLGPDGRPVPGARVGDLIAGADGSFRIEGAAPGVETTWTVAAAGWTCADLVAASPPAGEVLRRDVTLAVAPRVAGTISVEDGRPLPEGTAVRLQMILEREPGKPDRALPWLPGEPVHADGSYAAALTSRGPGRFRVAAHAPGRPVAMSGLVDLDPATESYRVDLALVTGQTITGRVLDGTTAAGIAGARVLVQDEVAAVTGESGEFTVTGLHAKSAYFEGSVVAPGYAPYVTQRFLGWTPAAENVVRLEPLREVSGTVTWQDGVPAAGAIVSVVRGAQRSSSGDDGRFVLRDVPVGVLQLQVLHPDAQTALVGVAAAGAETVNVALARGVSIAGRVVGADGRGVAQAALFAKSETRPDVVVRGRTGGDGAFTLLGLEPGAVYAINAVPPASPSAVVPDAGRYVTTAALGVASGTSDLVIRLRVGPVIEGVLTGEDGTPLAGVALTAADASGRWPQSATTDAAGRFAFRGLQPVPYTFRPSDVQRGYVEVRGGADVAAGTRDLALVAVAGAALAGVVVDERGGAVREAAVTVGAKTVRTNRDGAFTLTDLRRQPTAVTVDAPGFVPQTADGVTPGGDALRITLARGLAMSGRLTRADGSPLRARLDFHHATDARLFRQSWSGDDGRFRAEGFVDAEYRIVVVAGPQFVRQLGAFRAGTGTELDLWVE